MAAELAPSGVGPPATLAVPMDTAAPSTPSGSIRPDPPTLGTSPTSKRAARRVQAAFPDSIPNLTQDEICSAIAQQKAQHTVDALWMQQVEVAIADHAKRIDDAESVSAFLKHDLSTTVVWSISMTPGCASS